MWGRKGQKQNEFEEGRDGDHILNPFECDLCIFRKLKGRNPIGGKHRDDELLAYIRRMNLDAFWSRATSTVLGNRDKVKKMCEHSSRFGLSGPFVSSGPYPSYDHCGYEVALEMLMHSIRPGRNSESHLQFDTIRQFPTAYGNWLRASPRGSSSALGMVDSKGCYTRMADDPCASMWFQRFKEGCKNRMGQDWMPNQAMSVQLTLQVLQCMENKIGTAPNNIELNRWVNAHVFVMLSYVVSLRGPEGFLLDLEAINHHWDMRRNPEVEDYFYVCLRGKVKGESGARCHTLPCVAVTNSGLKVKETVGRLIKVKGDQGYVDGPAISDNKGRLASRHSVNDCFMEALEETFVMHQELFPMKIKELEHIRESYHIFRSTRRTSDTQALEAGVSVPDINLVNRWGTVERAKGKRPSRAMTYHYADVSILLKPFLRYTKEM